MRPHHTRALPTLVIAAGAWLLGSCDEPAAPAAQDVTGAYFLVEALGAEPPARIDTIVYRGSPWERWKMEWVAGRLLLVEGGRYRSDQVIRDTFEDGDVAERQHTTEGSYRVEGEMIYFQPDANLYHFPLSEATIEGDRLHTDTHGGVFRKAAGPED